MDEAPFVCQDCGKPIKDREIGSYVHITSCWAKVRKAGFHALALWETDNKHLCGACMRVRLMIAKRQFNPDQMELFERE